EFAPPQAPLKRKSRPVQSLPAALVGSKGRGTLFRRAALYIEGLLMRMKFGGGIGVLAAMVASVGAAGAADLGPGYTKAPPVIISDWTGFYIGVHGGYGWGDSTLSNFFNNADVPVPDAQFKQKGGVFGGHAGYNWQYGSVVTGLEIDFDGANIKDTNGATTSGNVVNPFTVKTNQLASARARLGYTLWPNLLAYATAGAGWAHPNPRQNGGDTGVDQFGWVAGAGLEYKFYGNWIARAEYLHYDFDKTGTDFQFPFSQTIDVVRGGLSYKF